MPPAQDRLFGELLSRHRVASLMTQETLAERAGVSVPGISNLERGISRAPRADTLAAIMDALRLSPSDRGDLERAALAARLRLPCEAPRGIPSPATPLVGRARERESLAALVQRRDVRLVTCTGPPGVGKTRLAVQVAIDLAGGAAPLLAGCTFVSLASLRDSALVRAQLEAAVGLLDDRARRRPGAFAQAVGERPFLLVVDNFEHVTGAARVLADLLAEAPELTILVTSRAVLRLRAEHEFRVPTLAFADAVALFCDRAREARSDFALTDKNARVVEGICGRLDGLPLALELAAARLRYTSPSTLHSDLKSRLAVLTDGPRDQPERQKTMRDAVAWSFDLLSSAEQGVLLTFATFSGGVSLDLAAAVGAPEEAVRESSPRSFAACVASLVEKNLLYLEGELDDETRFGMLQLVREFARERLDVAPARALLLRARHAHALAAIAREGAADLTGPNLQGALKRLEPLVDEFRGAMACSRDNGEPLLALEIAVSLFRFWYPRGDFSEGLSWLESILERIERDAVVIPDLLSARALIALGTLVASIGENERALRTLHGALAAAERAGSALYAAHAQRAMGWIAFGAGDVRAGVLRTERSVSLARLAGDTWATFAALRNLGTLAAECGRIDEAAARFEEALEIVKATGNRFAVAKLTGDLGVVASRKGDYGRAEALLFRALQVEREFERNLDTAVTLQRLADNAYRAGQDDLVLERIEEIVAISRDPLYAPGLIGAIELAACVRGRQGRAVLAVRLLAAACAARAAFGEPGHQAERARIDQTFARARRELGEMRFETARRAGAALDLSAATEAVLRGVASK